MKSLKFERHLVKLILDGSKTTTWRLFDDKDIQVGDELELVKRPELISFAKAAVTDVSSKPLKALTDEDMIGHEGVGSPEQMYKTYSGYYKQQVTSETVVKIIKFKLLRQLTTTTG